MSNPNSRQQRRRLLAGERDPLRQNLLALIDRVDGNTWDDDAAREFVAFAKMCPEAFPEGILALLLEDVLDSRREPILQALQEVARQTGKPNAKDLLTVARVALREHWGRDAATQIIAANADMAMFDDEELMVALLGAAGPIPILIGMRSIPCRPEPVIKLYDLEPKRMLEVIASELASVDGRRLRHAALAARNLMAERPGSAEALAEPIVGAMRRLSRRPSSEDSEILRHVLGDTVAIAPGAVDAAVDFAWQGAHPGERAALLAGYDGACRDRLSELELPPGVATSIGLRAMAAMRDRDPDLLHEAASTLELVCDYFPWQVEVPLADAIALLETLCQPRGSSLEAGQDVVEEVVLVPFRSIAKRAIETATVKMARSRVQEFWPVCEQAWHRAPAGSDFRSHLAHMIAALCKQHELIPDALPLLREVMDGADLNAKAAVLWNIAAYKWPKHAALPASFQAAVIEALTGHALETLEPAVEAVRQVQVDADQLPVIIERLGTVAVAVAAERACRRMADKAIESAIMMAKGTPSYDRAKHLALVALRRMYPLDTIESLRWRPELRDSPLWVPTAIMCLLRHDDHYWSLSGDHRARLVRELIRHRREEIEPYIEMLIGSARGSMKTDVHWVWSIADLLSHFGFYDHAKVITLEAWQTLSDQDNRLLKLEAEQAYAIHAFEAAIAVGDTAARNDALRQWRRANSEAEIEWERTLDA